MSSVSVMDDDAPREISADRIAAARDSLRAPGPAMHRMTVRVIPDLMAKPVEVWSADLGEVTDSGELALDIEAELLAAISGDVDFDLGSTRRYIEMGASAISVEVLLIIGAWALGGVVGNATYDLLKRTVRSITDKGQEHVEGLHEPMTADEAAERGKWRLSAAFDITPDEVAKLEVIGQEQRADGSWVIRYELADRRYEAEAVEEDGLVWIARVGWKQRDSEDDD
jgi:hypothetical protein